ncbi:hypothetical protein ACIRP3_43145 [Streptomyces sp. NPDC101209]|uniref:hypothetical protein n=1 Tax=Streptomyces sp. NPDC101209 TaxID=3366129 RepID=UPI003821F984
MRRTVLTLTALIALCAATGCSSDSHGTPATAPAPATTAASSEPAYTIDDCKTLLEEDYNADNVHDASDEAECQGLSEKEYTEAVGEVLKAHKDEILKDATDQTLYDEAWDSLDADTQQTICDTMDEEGTEPVAGLLDLTITDPSVDTGEMAQYLYDNKC